MKRKLFLKLCGTTLAVATSIILSCDTASAINYRITDLGRGQAHAINNSGQVTGSTFGSTGHAFLYSEGTMTDLGTLGGQGSTGKSINDLGHVAGISSTANNIALAFFSDGVNSMVSLGTLPGNDSNSPKYSNASGINSSGWVVGESWGKDPSILHAFLYKGGMYDLGTLGGNYSSAQDINSSGLVVGSSSMTGNTATHAFLYNGYKMIDLGTLGGKDSQAYAINDSGLVVGDSLPAFSLNQHAFLYNGSKMVDLGTLGGARSYAYGINNIGQAVGTADTANNSSHAFLYDGNGMIDLNSFLPSGSGWSYLYEARDINESGWIIGHGVKNGQYHAFLLAPVPTPEPSTFILAGAGIAILAVFRKKLSRKL